MIAPPRAGTPPLVFPPVEAILNYLDRFSASLRKRSTAFYPAYPLKTGR